MSGRIELVRKIFAAFDRGGWRAVLPMLDPEFEVVTTPEVAIEPGTYRGAAGVQRYWEAFDGAMEDLRMVLDGDPIDSGEYVVVAMRLQGRGTETGIEVERPAYMLWTFRAGRVLRVVVFADRAPALEAAGLDPAA